MEDPVFFVPTRDCGINTRLRLSVWGLKGLRFLVSYMYFEYSMIYLKSNFTRTFFKYFQLHFTSPGLRNEAAKGGEGR